MRALHVFFLTVSILIISASLLQSSSNAKDFGIEGHTFEIAEESILKVIEQRLSKIDLQKLNREMQNKTKKYVETPDAVKGITTAKESREFHYDPTYTLDHDIYNHKSILLHKAGTKVNPLNYMPLRESMLFIDGDNEAQVKYALTQLKEKKGSLKIILVKGQPLKIQRENKIWIYFDQAGVISSKLGIRQVPALVEQDGLKLKISIKGEGSYA